VTLLGNSALVAFPAIILGGLDSIPGAVVGGVAIGMISQLAQGYSDRFPSFLGSDFYGIVPYLVMILILLMRPYGLFGTRKVERV
jgi:branched-chain amino acid transport system permease protein